MKRITVAFLLVVILAIAALAADTTEGQAASVTNWDPSGQAMPVGNLPGWHQVFADNFAGDYYPVGSFTGCQHTKCKGTPSLPWGAVPDGRPDTSGHCRYYPSKTVSIQGGVLKIHMFTNSAGVCMDASLYPRRFTPLTYGRYSVRFRSAAVPGYKGVFILWPTDNTSGELDFPESNLNKTFQAAIHPVAGSHFHNSGSPLPPPGPPGIRRPSSGHLIDSPS